MSTVQIILLTIVVMMAYANAKPVGHDDNTRRVIKHHRRHVDNAITAYLAKGMRQGMRISVLRRLLSRPSYAGARSITMQIQPHPDHVPDRKDTALKLLQRINEETDNIRVRVVTHQDTTGLSRMEEFTRRAHALQQTAVMAKTCLELQQTILKMESMRIKVRCRSDPPIGTSRNAGHVSRGPNGFQDAVPLPSDRSHSIDQHRRNEINYRKRRS